MFITLFYRYAGYVNDDGLVNFGPLLMTYIVSIHLYYIFKKFDFK